MQSRSFNKLLALRPFETKQVQKDMRDKKIADQKVSRANDIATYQKYFAPNENPPRIVNAGAAVVSSTSTTFVRSAKVTHSTLRQLPAVQTRLVVATESASR